MQLISLNIWGGHVTDKLLTFIQEYQNVDFFCLQEVYHRAPYRTSTDDRNVCLDILDRILDKLPNHRYFFRPVVKNVYGLAMLIKRDIDLLHEGEVIIHENLDYPGTGPKHKRNLQWVECQQEGHKYIVINTHFLWNGSGKGDSEERRQQSRRVKDFLDTISVPNFLCGDFNLRPDTESIKILEESMRNLIKDYKITSTRTSLYPKTERFADYILTSPGIRVHDFKVLPDEVSDHAALWLDFSIVR